MGEREKGVALWGVASLCNTALCFYLQKTCSVEKVTVFPGSKLA